MEKSGRLLLTEEEWEEYSKGSFPSSLAQKGVLSKDQLSQIIDSGEYEVVVK